MLSPLKFEMHHENPPVLQVHDLISDTLINYVKNLSVQHLKRAKVVGKKSDAILSDVRTSSVAWLGDQNSKIPGLVNRATGLIAWDSKSAEDLQVQCYGSVGGYYVPHFDSLVDPGVLAKLLNTKFTNRLEMFLRPSLKCLTSFIDSQNK